MATLASSSSSLLFSSSSKLSPPSFHLLPRASYSISPNSFSLSSSLSISPYTTTSRRSPISSFSIRASAAEKKNVLIVNTNSGGHAVIGFYFAKELLSSGHSVTILTVGDESSDKMKKPPFSRFSEIVSAGGKTVWGNPADVGKAVEGAAFDVVLDNNGKDLDTVRPVVDWAKSSGVKQFLFISSAGIYKTTEEPPHVEGHFYAEPRAAKEILGWSSTTYLPEDLKERFEEYVKIGRDKKDIKFELDDKILESL